MSKTAPRLALAAALVGLAASSASAYVHYRMLRQPGYLSFCDVSATMSCTEVYASPYGSVGGVSVAVFGVIWFALAALLATAWLIGRPSVRESAPGYLFAGLTLGLSAVLYLGYASFVLLKLVCILCVITYAASVALFLASGAASSVAISSLPRRAFEDAKGLRSSPIGLVAGLGFIVLAALLLTLFPREVSIVAEIPTEPPPILDPSEQTEFERWYSTQPRVSLDVPAEGAKVLIVDFSDFQCPYCRQAYLTLKPLIAKFNEAQPGSVRLVLRDFPLESECNVSVTGGGPHPAACEAAVAARLAREQNRGEAMEDWLFGNQPAMSPPSVRQAARDVGQVPDFEAKYPAVLELVKRDIALGNTLGVKSTPTMFINGVKIEGVLAPQYLNRAISYELERAK